MAFLFGTSPAMRDLESRAASIGPSSLPILIEGESGTGKETLARHIHALRRPAGRFVRFSCRQAERSLALEGNWESGQKHTLFLKHVGILSQRLQEQLLALLEDGSIASEGLDHEDEAVRLVCSSSIPLENSVAHGSLLADLYFRLSACRIFVPPLREQPQAIPEFFAAMVVRTSGWGHGAAVRIPEVLSEALVSYAWPGNFRELQAVARNYAASEDVQQIVADLARRSERLVLRNSKSGEPLSLREQVRKASRQLEAGIILRTLESHRWNRRRAAQTLKISYRALLYKMKDCNLKAGMLSVPGKDGRVHDSMRP